uniref:Uncharacterized protein n=1 Tax=Anguilla anguilla TaxID=7936 RepID=A0A0E9Q0S1_ANGAN
MCFWERQDYGISIQNRLHIAYIKT